MNMCPIDTFCFDKTTFIIIIVGCIVFIAHYIGEVSNKVSILEKNIEKNDDKMNSKITKYRNKLDTIKQLNHNLTLASIAQNNQNTLFQNRVHNPLTPPERTYPYHNNRIPVNIATRGEPSQFQQVGVLIQDDGAGNNQVKLPLFGQQLYPRSKEWRYYTGSDGYQSVKLSLNHDGRDSMDQYGCRELYDGNVVDVNGYDSKFKVTIYKLDAPKYIPNMI